MYALILTALIVLLFLGDKYIQYKQERLIHDIKMKQERNRQVLLFRWYVLHIFGMDAYKGLPDYKFMLDSKKPLVVKEWVEVDKIVNLN